MLKLNFSKKALIGISVGIIIIIALIPSFYFYNQYQSLQKKLSNPNISAAEETQKLIEKLGKLIELPTDEVPQVATVSDPEKLKDQAFFARAKAGDKVLFYTNAKRAILYDPVANKIIDVAPVNISTQSADNTNPAANTSPTPQPVRFVLLNGTTTVGLTKKYEETLKKTIPAALVVNKDNAKKTDYIKTILVDLSGTRSTEAEQISKVLNISSGKLPEGETKPADADFLIILGEDKK